jgi:hypothetical protein
MSYVLNNSRLTGSRGKHMRPNQYTDDGFKFISCRLPQEMVDAIRAKAAAEERSLSVILRRALRRELDIETA